MGLTKPTSEELALFQELIARESGLTFAPERLGSLEAALAKRSRECGLSSFNEYSRLLSSRPEGRFELRNLLDLLTVGETRLETYQNMAETIRHTRMHGEDLCTNQIDDDLHDDLQYLVEVGLGQPSFEHRVYDPGADFIDLVEG